MAFRDYLYLDRERLQNYLSSIDAGEIQEFTETIRSQSDKEGRAGVKATVLGAGVDAGAGGRSEEESTQERVVRITAQHMFSRIYEELNKEGEIKVFDEDESLTLERVHRRDIVEVTRAFSPSPLNEMIDGILKLMNVMEEMGFVEEIRGETQQAVRALAMIFRGDEGKEEVPMVSRAEHDDVSVVFLAKSKYIVGDPEDFTGEMTVFGRVQKLIPEGKSVDLFDYLKLPRPMRGEAKLKEELFQLFGSWPTELGGPIDKKSAEVNGPALVITPIAVYEA